MKKLAIVGTHPDTRENAPFDDPEFDVWVFNEAAAQPWCKRWTACFQLHKPEVFQSPHNRSDADHWNWLQQNHGERRIIMQDQYPQVPNSEKYPLEQARALIGGWNYFSSTIVYALALAALEGYDIIEIYGSDLTSNTEYTYQADGLRSWVMFLRGRGVQVLMKCWPAAFEQPLYGYEGQVGLGSEFYAERLMINRNEWDSAEKALKNLKKAALRDLDNGDLDKFREKLETLQDAVMQSGKCSARVAVAEKYAGYTRDWDDRQEFEIAAATAQRDGVEPQVMMYRMAGAIEYVWNVAKQTNNPRASIQIVNFLETMLQHGYKAGAMDGINKENLFYMGIYDGLAQAAGGQKTIDLVKNGDN